MVPQLQMLQKWIKPAFIVLAVIGCIAIGKAVADFVWFFSAKDDQVVHRPAKQSVNSAQPQKNSQAAIRNLSQLNLFGVASAKVPKKPQQKVATKTTRLRFTLKGVFTAERPEDSSAIIQFGPGAADEGHFNVGETIKGQAKLSAVYSDRVILDNRGTLESLLFPEAKGKNGLTRNPTPPRRSGSNVSSNNQQNQTTNKKSTQSEVPLAQRSLASVRSPEEFTEVARAQLDENPQKALASVGLEPVDTSGSAQGYRVGKQATMLRGLGLKEGDVIKTVNGIQVGDLNSDQELLEQVMSQGKVKVEIERGNRRFVINHRL